MYHVTLFDWFGVDKIRFNEVLFSFLIFDGMAVLIRLLLPGYTTFALDSLSI